MGQAVDALEDFLRRHCLPEGGSPSGGTAGRAGVHGAEAGVQYFTECGFGRGGGIPTCTVLESSDQEVTWTRSEDVPRLGKKLANQQVEKKGKLRDLSAEFKTGSKLYMPHYEKAEWQRDCHGLCLDTFKDGDIVIETHFIEKYSHVPGSVLTCARHAQTTLIVAIVHFSLQVWEGGGRVDVNVRFRGH